MDCCSVHKCRQEELSYVNQLRKLTKQQEKQSKAAERKFKKELKQLKNRRKKQLAAVNKAVKKMSPNDKRKCRVFRTPSQIIVARKCNCKKRLLKYLSPCVCYIGIGLGVAAALLLPASPWALA